MISVAAMLSPKGTSICFQEQQSVNGEWMDFFLSFGTFFGRNDLNVQFFIFPVMNPLGNEKVFMLVSNSGDNFETRYYDT